ncbi:MAG TPA: putative sulfate/molybdate transporter [Burkholderiales bacterium]|nr:putative sulfate/molybdate transporter [Burkholderiales bacterium]
MAEERLEPATSAGAVQGTAAGNRYNRMEWAGAFGDLGTLIPFVVGYIGMVGMDPFGILLAFGISLIVCGAYYRTPMPIQPMKAAGAVAVTQAAQTAVITPAAVVGASLATGLLWLVLGLTGTARRIAVLVPRFVVIGIVLGLGMGFMIEGVKMMATGWIIATIGFVGTLLLLTNRSVPAMFILLLFGGICGVAAEPAVLQRLAAMSIEFRSPSFAPAALTWKDLGLGLVFLALPQIPLTLGNAIIATAEENNRLFPDRAVNEDKLSTSTGILNLFSASVGGIPMCHGAGGMAGHVTFGARTGGATIILGIILLLLALFLSGSIETLFSVLPKAVLGVILFLTGAQLALGSCDFSKDKVERFITLITAAFCVWNVGLGFIVGLLAAYLKRRGLVKL